MTPQSDMRSELADIAMYNPWPQGGSRATAVSSSSFCGL